MTKKLFLILSTVLHNPNKNEVMFIGKSFEMFVYYLKKSYHQISPQIDKFLGQSEIKSTNVDCRLFYHFFKCQYSRRRNNVALSDICLTHPIFYKTLVKTFILATKLSSPTQKALYSIAFLCVVVVVEMNCELTLLISLVIPKIYTLLIISKRKVISVKMLSFLQNYY